MKKQLKGALGPEVKQARKTIKLSSKKRETKSAESHSNYVKLGKKPKVIRCKNSESSLWKAVIMQAVLDMVSRSKRAENILARDSARSWFNLKNKNFMLVCEYAKLEPTWVIARIDLALKNLKLWRRDCDIKHILKFSDTPEERE